MTTEEIIIAIYRVIGSLPVLVFPFPGAIFAMLVDNFDVLLKGTLDEGGVSDYHSFDKWLDLVYMVTFLIVALRWRGTPRNIAVGLFVYRMIGVVAFEVTENRDVLIFFPNLFEFWFVFVAGAKFLRLDERWQGEPRYGRVRGHAGDQAPAGVRAARWPLARRVHRRRDGRVVLAPPDAAVLGGT